MRQHNTSYSERYSTFSSTCYWFLIWASNLTKLSTLFIITKSAHYYSSHSPLLYISLSSQLTTHRITILKRQLHFDYKGVLPLYKRQGQHAIWYIPSHQDLLMQRQWRLKSSNCYFWTFPWLYLSAADSYPHVASRLSSPIFTSRKALCWDEVRSQAVEKI